MPKYRIKVFGGPRIYFLNFGGPRKFILNFGGHENLNWRSFQEMVSCWRSIRDTVYCGKVWHRNLSQKVKSFSIFFVIFPILKNLVIIRQWRIFLRGLNFAYTKCISNIFTPLRSKTSQAKNNETTSRFGSICRAWKLHDHFLCQVGLVSTF